MFVVSIQVMPSGNVKGHTEPANGEQKPKSDTEKVQYKYIHI
mgnify:CR=1 FL=1